MNIEEAREYALSLHAEVKESMFVDDWLEFRINGKWFMLIWLNAPEPRLTLKCDPDVATELRERYIGVTPAYHMNKRLWNDVYLNRDLNNGDIRRWIRHSYGEVVGKFAKAAQKLYAIDETE